MGAIIDLVLVPAVGAIIGGLFFGPWGLFLGLVGGFFVGAISGQASGERNQRIAELEEQAAEYDQRIDELERRLDELEEE